METNYSVRKISRLASASALLALAFLCSPKTFAALTISTDSTENVTCTENVCTATAADAVMNAGELATMLATSSVHLKAGADAQDIVFAAPITWNSAKELRLDAYHSIEIDQLVSITGFGAVTITTNRGGSDGVLFFGSAGRISFPSVANHLRIDGKRYQLAGNIAQLAANIAASPDGYHALANDYNASIDGSYSRVPIPTTFEGVFDGLGNAISNLALYDTADNNVAFFAAVDTPGVLRNVRLLNVNMFSENGFVQFLAPLVAYNAGAVLRCQATGAVRSDFWVTAGGLVSLNYGRVENCFANVAVSGAQTATVGGLIGNAHGVVRNCYATGKVIAGDRSDVGGLVGYFIGARLSRTYSTGQVSGGASALVGGLLGENRGDASGGTVDHSYWATDTSTRTNGTGYGDASMIRGVRFAQLQIALPPDFDRSVWARRSEVNDGLPYLRQNPPR